MHKIDKIKWSDLRSVRRGDVLQHRRIKTFYVVSCRRGDYFYLKPLPGFQLEAEPGVRSKRYTLHFLRSMGFVRMTENLA